MTDEKNIECEIRGQITRGDFNEIKSEIENDFGKMKQGPELVIFFKGEYDLRLKFNKSGGILAWKQTVSKKTSSKKEVELKFSFDSILGVIEFLDKLGFNNGLFSYCYRFDSPRKTQQISIKFNTQIGDLFEIDEMTKERNDFDKIYKNLTKIANKYGLKPWKKEAYNSILKSSWKDVNPESLIINGKIHFLIKKVIEECSSSNNIKELVYSNNTIADILKKKDNDYSKLEKMYKAETGEDLLAWKHGSLNSYQEFISIIIPTYNSWKELKLTCKSIERQKVSPKQKKMIEVIIVNDGSDDKTEENLKKEKFNLNIKYIRQNNLGRSYARNLGVAVSVGEILLFIDSDIILGEHFLNEHIKKHHYLDNIVLVSFKENILPDDTRIKNYYQSSKNLKINIKNDFRFEKKVKQEWLRMHRHVRNVEVRNVKLLEETDNFKKFGNDLVFGVWDLPSMVVTNAVSIKREAFKKIGGFNLQFKGWGMEDTFLGACLIASGNYVIPCFSTGIVHIEHAIRSGSQKKQMQEFNKNVLVYLDLINKRAKQVFNISK